MNGNFEVQNSAYPIGYLINGGATSEGPTYDIVDMRTLQFICTSTLTAKQIAKVAAALNENMRNGEYKGENQDAAIAADARGYVEIIQAQGEFAHKLEVPEPEGQEPVACTEAPELPVQSVLPTLPTLPVIGG